MINDSSPFKSNPQSFVGYTLHTVWHGGKEDSSLEYVIIGQYKRNGIQHYVVSEWHSTRHCFLEFAENSYFLQKEEAYISRWPVLWRENPREFAMHQAWQLSVKIQRANKLLRKVGNGASVALSVEAQANYHETYGFVSLTKDSEYIFGNKERKEKLIAMRTSLMQQWNEQMNLAGIKV